jgi:hypothetical protein
MENKNIGPYLIVARKYSKKSLNSVEEIDDFYQEEIPKFTEEKIEQILREITFLCHGDFNDHDILRTLKGAVSREQPCAQINFVS